MVRRCDRRVGRLQAAERGARGEASANSIIQFSNLTPCHPAAGTLWYAVATGVSAGYKLLSAARDEKPVPVLLVATAAAAAYAIWQNEAFLYSLVAYIVQTLWGGFTTLQRLAKSLD